MDKGPVDFLVRARALAEPKAVGKVSEVDGRDPELAGRRGDIREWQSQNCIRVES